MGLDQTFLSSGCFLRAVPPFSCPGRAPSPLLAQSLESPPRTRSFPVCWIAGRAFMLRNIDISRGICEKDIVTSQFSKHHGSYFRVVSSAYVVLFLPQNALIVCEVVPSVTCPRGSFCMRMDPFPPGHMLVQINSQCSFRLRLPEYLPLSNQRKGLMLCFINRICRD